MRQNNKTMTIMVMTGLLTAITLLCTFLFKLPIGPSCYIHLGDAIVFLSVIILPRRYACFAGGAGAALADLMGGFGFWAPWSFIIKVGMVIILGLFIDIIKKRMSNESKIARVAGIPVSELIGYVLASCFAVVGYYVAEGLMYGNWIAPLADIPLNFVQTGVGAVIAILVSNALSKSNMKESMYYNR